MKLSKERLSLVYGGKKYRGPSWRCIADSGIGAVAGGIIGGGGGSAVPVIGTVAGAIYGAHAGVAAGIVKCQ